MNTPQPVIAVSSCLLGNRVRYNGEIKQFDALIQQLQQHFEFIAVCPEVEIGLPVPRPPVQLSGDAQAPRMTGRDDATLDITERMRAYCVTKPRELEQICGYVFKSRSPSCGLHDVPLFDAGKIILPNHRGLFAQAITARWPDLPVADELQLNDATARAQFIRRVLDFHSMRQK